jgi:aspartate aminotransferase, cytoplasmic
LHASLTNDHEYLPIAGLPDFIRASQRLVFGANNSTDLGPSRIASVQTLSGTGALHLGFLLLKKFSVTVPSQQVYLSDPPYANHIPIVRHVGLKHALYPYYSSASKKLDLRRMLEHLTSVPAGSIIVLHACAHNPTGVDPSQADWKRIARCMKARKLLPFFDSAYQGLASGDVEEDAWSVRHFVSQGFPLIFVAQSYAKNMGLYGERTGCLHVMTAGEGHAGRIASQLKQLQRVEISTPPKFGAFVAATILNDDAMYQQWLRDLRILFDRISRMRRELRQRLERGDTCATWQHLTEQKGMFCFSGLKEHEVQILRNRFHIYTTPDGRFSISGLNSRNVAYVAGCILEVTRPLTRL